MSKLLEELYDTYLGYGDPSPEDESSQSVAHIPEPTNELRQIENEDTQSEESFQSFQSVADVAEPANKLRQCETVGTQTDDIFAKHDMQMQNLQNLITTLNLQVQQFAEKITELAAQVHSNVPTPTGCFRKPKTRPNKN